MTAGLLAVLSEPGVVPEAEFHDWYDREHVPPRLMLDGIHTARRLRAADEQRPTWLALYDIDLEVLARPEYRGLRERRSTREQQLMARLETLDRRVYELVSEHGDTARPPRLVIAVSLDVPQRCEGELDDWYEHEHIPLLLGIPGWVRTRRYRLSEGAACRWLALHELDDPEALQTDAYRHATSTPWRSAVMSTVTDRERRAWTPFRDF